MASYNYTLGVDFALATNIDLSAFQITIAGSSISTATIQYLSRNGTLVTIYFSGILSGGDITTLNGLVAAYVYVAPTDLVYVDTTTQQTVANKFWNCNSVYFVDPTITSKQIAFQTSGASTSTTMTIASVLAASRTYTVPDTGATSSFLMTDSTGTQTISTGNLTLSGTSATLALSGASSKILLTNTTISTSTSTGSVQCSGGIYSLNHFIGGGIFPNMAGTLIGPLFNVAATTITATNTSDMAFVSIQQPTLANSVTASTTINASTLYIANAPASGTNQTITNTYALNIASGKVRIGGILQIPTGASNGFYLQSDASGNSSWAVVAFAGFIDGSVSAPGAYWLSQTSTGFYKPGSGQINIALAGTNTAGFTTTSTFSSVSLNLTGTGSTIISSSTLYSNPASTTFASSNNYFFNYFNTPTTTGSTTGTASTVFIAGAPANATTAYALNIASGNTLIGGNLTLNATSAVLSLTGTSSSLSVSGISIATSSTTGSIITSGGIGISDNIWYGSSITNSLSTSLNGILLNMATLTYTDSAIAGTITNIVFNGIQQPTLASTNARTTTNAITYYIAGAPIKGTNETFTNAYGLYIDSAITTLATVSQAASLYIVNAPTLTTGTSYALLVAAGNSLFGGNLTLNNTSAVLALSGASSTLTLANTIQSISSTTGALQCSGGLSVKNIWLAGVSFSNQVVSLNGPILNVPATTITATNTADMSFISIQQPTLANSVAASTTANASTLYIANAPASGINETITNAFALNVAAGKTRIGGALQITTGASSGFVLTSDASGNASWASSLTATILAYFNSNSTTTFSTNATASTNISSMTLTPTTAGTYYVIFTSNFRVQSANTTATFDLALNGVSITNTTNIFSQNAQLNTYSVTITCIQAFNGSSNVVTARVYSSSGTSSITINYRSIFALRMSA